MPTGERQRHRVCRRRCGPCRRGFSYLGLILLLALLGATLAAAGQRWRLNTWREQELDSRARGEEIARAIAAWRAATPGGAAAARGPTRLEDLLEDRRSGQLRRHLRRLYVDPLTGAADWVPLRDASGALVGVHSRATRQAVITVDLAEGGGGGPYRVSDRLYRIPATASAAASAASATSSAKAVSVTPTGLR